jgi:hypothetical protein
MGAFLLVFGIAICCLAWAGRADPPLPQRGCVYCTRMHTEVLALNYINDYVRENFNIVQLDVQLVQLNVQLVQLDVQLDLWGAKREVARMHLGIEAGTFYDMFAWVRAKVYEKDRNFQRFHLDRAAAREALKAGAASPRPATR